MLSTTIRLAGRRVHLVRRASDCNECENRAEHTLLEMRFVPSSEIARAVHSDASALADFRDLAATFGVLYDVHRLADTTVVEHVDWLVKTGCLIAVECRIRVTQGMVAPLPAAPRPRPSRPQPGAAVVDEPTKTWVEIQLLDHTGMPVANEKYHIEAPGGVIRDGTLDAQGRARIPNIDPGMCDISFPDIDGRELKEA